MFTGIIEALGTVAAVAPQPDGSAVITIDAGPLVADLPQGGSLAVNGVCLTAVPVQATDEQPAPGQFTADVMGETLRLTSLGALVPGSHVNLERCLSTTGRFDGHIVQGHVDGTGTLESVTDHGTWAVYRFTVPDDLAPFLALKGSIAIDGISLTISGVSAPDANGVPDSPGTSTTEQTAGTTSTTADRHWVEVSLIPATRTHTIMGTAELGQTVNLEVDVFAKYAARLASFADLPNPTDPASHRREGEQRAPEGPVNPNSPPLDGPAAQDTTAAAPNTPTAATPPADTADLDTIPTALDQLRQGRPIIVVDDANRENEGDFIMPAATVTPEWMGLIIRHSSGVVCAPMTADRAAALNLPPMVTDNQDPKGTAYTVSCDAAHGTSTGISAADRALTAAVLADPASTPDLLNRPGHLFPLIAKDGGVRERAGHTEAGVEFARLAGFEPTAVIAEVVHDSGPMMRLDDLLPFGRRLGLAVVSIEDLAAYLDERDAAAHGAAGAQQTPGSQTAAGATARATATSVDAPIAAPTRAPVLDSPAGTAPVTLPGDYGVFSARGWMVDGAEHMTLSAPGPTTTPAGTSPAGTTTSAAGSDAADPAPLVRVHSECLTGDVFASHRCDCGEQLATSLRRIAAEGGTLVYLRGQEGRGIGLFNKLRAYALQEQGRDTVDANTELGLPVDARDYAAAAHILREGLGIERVRLLTNNPAKVRALRSHGVAVDAREPIETTPRRENASYLRTKRERMSHALTVAQAPAGTRPATAASPTTERRAS